MPCNAIAKATPGSAYLTRRAEKAIANLQTGVQVETVAVAAKAAVQTTKVEAVAYVGRAALIQTALLTQTEQGLGQLVPLAVSRLQAIADITTLQIAEVVSDTVREVRS